MVKEAFVAALNLEDDETRITVVVDGMDVPVFESLGELRQWAADNPGVEFVKITYVSRDNSGEESYEGGASPVQVEDDGQQVEIVVTSSMEPLGTLISTLNTRAFQLGREPLVEEYDD